MNLASLSSTTFLVAGFALASCAPEAAIEAQASAVELQSVATQPPNSAARLPGAASFEQLVSENQAAVAARDYGKIVALSFPDSLFDHIARQSGKLSKTDHSEVKNQVQMLVKKTYEERILEIVIDPSNSIIQKTQRGRAYALVPASLLMNIDGQRVRSTNNYVAIEDDGRWFILNPSSDSTIKMMRAAYPDLAEVALSAPRMETISQ